MNHSSSLVRRRNRGRRPRRANASMFGQFSNWHGHTVRNAEAERQLERVGERALDLYTNDAMGHGVLESLLVEAVGIGLTPQPSPMSSWIGMSSEWEDQFQEDSLRCFAEWGLDFRNWCDASRRLNILMMQGLAYFNWKLLGVGVFQVVTCKDTFSPFSLSLLPIDPFRLVTPTDKRNADVYDGIEVDRNGAPIAVYIQNPESKSPRPSASNCTRIEVKDKSTGLPKILLVSDVRNIAEYRQDSILGPMVGEIRTSNDLAEAVVVSAMVRNLYTMFVNDYGQGGVAKDTPWEKRIIETEKGTILVGSGKEKPYFYQHTAAPTGYTELFDGIIDRLGMATGRGSENVRRKFQASYSASRANMEKADQFDERDHMIMNNRFNLPWWSWLMYEASLRGKVKVRSTQHFLQNLHAYTNTQFLPQPFRHIDREKTAKANKLDHRGGRLRYEEIYGQKGQNWKEGLRKYAKELKYIQTLADKYGVPLMDILFGDGQVEPETKPENEGGDDESKKSD